MEMRKLPREGHKVSTWSGGSTTQVYIFPEEADYGKRDFLFRVSSAGVDCDRSDFTPLPGVERHIMVLKGALRLLYEGHGEKDLAVLEQDTFSGDWHTVSLGKAQDFNLMLREGTKGCIQGLRLKAGESHTFTFFPGEKGVLLLYQGSGEGNELSLSEWDGLLCQGPGELNVKAQTDCILALARVQNQ